MTLEDGNTVYVNLKKLMQNENSAKRRINNKKITEYKL